MFPVSAVRAARSRAVKKAGLFIFALSLSWGLFFTLSGIPRLHAARFRTANPYFLKGNGVFLGLEADMTGLSPDGALLTRFELALDYGINENALAGVMLPYLFVGGAEDGGTLGDILIYGKFLLYQPADLLWRIVFELPLRIPTGLIREDSFRRVDGVQVSYYPFVSGAAGLAPALQGSVFLGGFMALLRAAYVSENQPGENVLDFNVLQDRVDFQLSVDHLWKFELAPNITLYEKPSLAILYGLNLSPSPMVPDTLLIVLENQLKLNDEWRIRASFVLPVIALREWFRYNVAVQLGRYF